MILGLEHEIAKVHKTKLARTKAPRRETKGRKTSRRPEAPPRRLPAIRVSALGKEIIRCKLQALHLQLTIHPELRLPPSRATTRPGPIKAHLNPHQKTTKTATAIQQ